MRRDKPLPGIHPINHGCTLIEIASWLRMGLANEQWNIVKGIPPVLVPIKQSVVGFIERYLAGKNKPGKGSEIMIITDRTGLSIAVCALRPVRSLTRN